jgi:acyl carrier protein
MSQPVGAAIRHLLAELLDDPAVASLPDDTLIFSGGLGLSSLTGVALLTVIKRDFGVDVATVDVALESLQTIGTLAAFVERSR